MDIDKDAQVSSGQAKDRLKAMLLRRLPPQARITTEIDGLTLSRRDTVNQPESCFYRPTVGVVIQGFKRSIIGNEEYRYGEGWCMTAAVDMPCLNHITVASPEKPFLALSIKLDRYIIAQLMAEIPLRKSGNGANAAVTVTETRSELLDAFLRLVELLDNPERIPILAPMIIREIHFYLLAGPQGNCLRLVSTQGTQINQIALAVSWLRENYREPLRIDVLAQQVNMAESTFNRHFHRVTTLSPLQFQKRLRLYEAQRLMLTADKDAASAALEVGYESTTQFSREYKREFGDSPYRHVRRLLAAGFAAGAG
jgi:AraC-like DNA-binding protein